MTKKTKNSPILVPVDFSDHSEHALLCAAEMAGMMNSPMIIMHVVHDPGEAPGYYSVKGHNKQLVRMEDVAGDMLEAFLKKIRQKHPGLTALKHATPRLVTGLPVNQILEVARQTHARLIVMGSQGRTGLSHLMLGSKAEQVVRLAPIPVTIVKTHRKNKS